MGNEDLAIITHGPEQTQEAGITLGKFAESGDLICLIGDLGAGKTCFTQGFAWGIGFDGYVTSPSFVLVKQYIGRLKVFHIDFYRLDSMEEIAKLGMEDMMEEGVCVIEWADKGLEWLPPEHLLITFENLSENERSLRFEPFGKRYRDITERMKQAWNCQ